MLDDSHSISRGVTLKWWGQGSLVDGTCVTCFHLGSGLSGEGYYGCA